MASKYLIQEPTEDLNISTRLGLGKGVKLLDQNAEQYAFKPNTSTEKWWAIGMIANNGSFFNPLIVSNTKNYSLSYSNNYYNDNDPLTRTDYTKEFTYNGTTYYASFGAYGSTGSSYECRNAIVPIYIGEASDDIEYMGKKLIELYLADGGTLPGEDNPSFDSSLHSSWIQRKISDVWQKTFAFAHAKTVYTDYKNKKTLDTTLKEMSDSIGGKANADEIPTKVSQLTNDSGYQTKSEVATAVDDGVKNKVDKVDGKGLSTNDFTTEEKAKLANIDDEATATTVDSTLSDTSTNPVQNKVAKAELDKKAPTANPVFTGSISMGREDNTTVGSNSVAAGDAVMATGVASHAEGIKTIAASDYQHVQGKYNVEDTENKYAHIVGGGSDGDNRKNIHTIDWDGNGYYAGNMDAKNTTVNLLNPTLQTTTVNSVTCTNNGDGTYTLNGTASADTWFAIINNTENTNLLGNYALAGAPNGFSRNLAIYFRERNDNTNVNSIRNGKIINVLNYYKYYACYIICYSGESMNNVTFKPMLTTNLNATYDDFAPYTGDSGSLNGDVADLKSELSTKFQVLTQAQYNALSDEQKNNGTIYLVD